MRKNLYIIGARGFGREMSLGLLTWNGFSDQYIIKGFLDDKADALDPWRRSAPEATMCFYAHSEPSSGG